MASAALRRWDMTGLLSPLGVFGQDEALEMLDALLTTAETALEQAARDEGDDASLVGAFERILPLVQELLRVGWTVETLLYAPLVVDARNARAQREWSAFQHLRQRVQAVETWLTDWVGGLDVERLIANSEQAAEHAYLLRRAVAGNAHRMTPPEEALAADLAATGAAAWRKLYGDIWSQMRVEVVVGGERRTRAMGEVRLMAQSEDRALRQAAHEGELRAWERVSLPLAAALNGVKGHALSVSQRRDWDSLLDVACCDNEIDRMTLDAMLRAVQRALPGFQRYLRAKARALGLRQLAWFDLYAPVGESRRAWQYEEARDLILQAYARYAPRLHALAARAFNEHWIDAASRDGKQGGGLCLSLPDGTSRITVNFAPTFMGMRQLAHELGHAYHNHVLIEAGRSMWQWAETPATLAETAAIFCESLVRDALLDAATAADRLFILDATLQNTCRFIAEGLASQRFEERLLDLRRTRELSVAELKTLTLECQHEAWGDALDPAGLHPYMWAYRPHAFTPEMSFAAIPYMFGQLFSYGLLASYRAQPDTFPAAFDTLLASASTADLPTLAARLGIDLRDDAFWQASVDVILGEVEQFEQAVEAGATNVGC